MQLNVALTVVDVASGRVEDVLVSGDVDQPVSALVHKLAEYLAEYLDLPARTDPARELTLRVERTGEQLPPDAPLGVCDLLEGDRLLLAVSERRRPRPRWLDDDDDGASNRPVVPLSTRRTGTTQAEAEDTGDR